MGIIDSIRERFKPENKNFVVNPKRREVLGNLIKAGVGVTATVGTGVMIQSPPEDVWEMAKQIRPNSFYLPTETEAEGLTPIQKVLKYITKLDDAVNAKTTLNIEVEKNLKATLEELRILAEQNRDNQAIIETLEKKLQQAEKDLLYNNKTVGHVIQGLTTVAVANTLIQQGKIASLGAALMTFSAAACHWNHPVVAVVEATVGAGCVAVSQGWYKPVKAKAQKGWQWVQHTAKHLATEAKTKAKSLA